MKKLLTYSSFLVIAVTAQASVTISGTSILDDEILGSSVGVYISSNTGSFNEVLFEEIYEGTSFTNGSSVFDENNQPIAGYTVLGSAPVNTAGTNGALGAGITFDLGGNVATGNEIGVLVFSSSTTSAINEDTFSIWTNDWLVAADGSNLSLTGTGAPYMGGTAAGTGTVVPEPSTYAMLAGALALGYVMVRRRKA